MSAAAGTMEKEAGKKNGMLRLFFVAVAILLELAILLGMLFTGLGRYAQIIALGSRIAAFFLVLGIYSQKKSASIKMPWIILMLLFPAIGISLYFMIGLSGSTAKMKKRFEKVDAILFPYLVQNRISLEELEKEAPTCSGISRYLVRHSGYPVYSNTKVTYYSDASAGLEAQKQAMKKAKHFIFMEYFAIEDAQSWQGIEDILEERVRAGVEVRVFYDDFGSIGFINMDFAKKLQKKGIQCRVFNPMVPLFNLFLNNRDHRKMTIIDNEIGFTGGYNIANEYFNISSPYGHWKDTGVCLRGEAVRAMTVAFLEMWNAMRADGKKDSDVSAYLRPYSAEDGHGYVQFYAVNPMEKKVVGEDVYLSLANRAQKYLYIMTPYLIVTDEMSRMLGLAAKRGVDVRIITPGIPDKKLVYQLTRSYYNRLVCDGVRIYEYTPGFCHAKMYVSDDVVAACGTINMDYRSLYHHFEDGCLIFQNTAVMDIKYDFENTMSQCMEVTEKYRSGRSAVLRFSQLVLRLFAPLM